jgi:hypothetical protein
VSEKQDLINRMLELQKKFIEYEQGHGLDPRDYYAPDADHPLAGYREEYADLADRVVNLAHAEKGSIRD